MSATTATRNTVLTCLKECYVELMPVLLKI